VGGTSGLKRHTALHQRSIGTKRSRDGFPMAFKNADREKVASAAALAVIQGLLAFSFADSNAGMEALVRAVFEVGQSYRVGNVMNVKTLLPSHTTVRSAVKILAAHQRQEFRDHNLKSLLKYGGGSPAMVEAEDYR